jgi:hypothetical protein
VDLVSGGVLILSDVIHWQPKIKTCIEQPGLQVTTPSDGRIQNLSIDHVNIEFPGVMYNWWAGIAFYGGLDVVTFSLSFDEFRGVGVGATRRAPGAASITLYRFISINQQFCD